MWTHSPISNPEATSNYQSLTKEKLALSSGISLVIQTIQIMASPMPSNRQPTQRSLIIFWENFCLNALSVFIVFTAYVLRFLEKKET